MNKINVTKNLKILQEIFLNKTVEVMGLKQHELNHDF